MRLKFIDKYDWHWRFAWMPVLAVKGDAAKWEAGGLKVSANSLKWVWLEWVERKLVARERADCRGSEFVPIYRFK